MSERFIEPGVALPHKHTPESETRKTPSTENVPVGGQEPTHTVPEDEVVELHTGTEEEEL